MTSVFLGSCEDQPLAETFAGGTPFGTSDWESYLRDQLLIGLPIRYEAEKIARAFKHHFDEETLPAEFTEAKKRYHLVDVQLRSWTEAVVGRNSLRARALELKLNSALDDFRDFAIDPTGTGSTKGPWAAQLLSLALGTEVLDEAVEKSFNLIRSRADEIEGLKNAFREEMTLPAWETL